MQNIIIITAAAVLAGCVLKELQKQKPFQPLKAEPPTAKAPEISIFDAVQIGNIEAVKQHLARGTNVNLKNDGGSTPLIEASRKGYKEIAKLLIENGADVNCKLEYTTDIESIEGWTSLHVAAAKGYKVIAELLIIKGADVNAMDDTRRSPLDWAQIIKLKHSKKIKDSKKEIADLLRKYGGKPGYEL